jgi:hypothetical protein
MSHVPGLLNREPYVSASGRVDALSVRLAQLFLFAWILVSLVNGLKAALWFDGFPDNGPFQLYDPLRRMAAGQHVGQDFQFFHGIGIPFLHYPIFKLCGGHSVVAGELSRQFTSLLLFSFTLWAFVRVTFRESAARWIAAAAAVLALEALFRGSAEPGHSLVSGRSAFPILAFTVLQLRVSQTVKALLTGGCIACAFLFGTEHGISLSLSLLAVTAFSAVQSLRSRPHAWETLLANVRFLVVTLVTAGLSAAALLCLICGIHGAGTALHFNLVDLPANQFWLFGSPPMPYLHAWRQFFFDHHVILCFLPTAFILALLVVLLCGTARSPLRIGSDWRGLAAIMLVYAALTAIPLIGILSRHYTYPQARVVVLLTLLAVAELSRSGRIPFRSLPRWSAATLSVVALLAGGAFLAKAGSTANSLVGHWRNHPAQSDPKLDEYWNSFMAGATRAIEEHRTRPGISLWSEYVALLDDHYGTFQAGEDYIIHALGSGRWNHYIEAFRASNPEFVTMMTSQFSFDEWLQDEHWEFYEEVLNNYRPIAEVEHALIWQRGPGPWVYPAQTFQGLALNNTASNATSQSVTLPVFPDSEQIVVVRVRYTVSNRWRKLPLLGVTPRYIANVEGTPRDNAISFPPDLTEFQFPVKLAAGKPVTLRFQTESLLPHAALHIEKVDWKPLTSQPGLSQMFAQRVVPSRY